MVDHRQDIACRNLSRRIITRVGLGLLCSQRIIVHLHTSMREFFQGVPGKIKHILEIDSHKNN
jgi:hypothetical protein